MWHRLLKVVILFWLYLSVRKWKREMILKTCGFKLEFLREFYLNEVSLTTVFIYLHDVGLYFFQMTVQPPKDEWTDTEAEEKQHLADSRSSVGIISAEKSSKVLIDCILMVCHSDCDLTTAHSEVICFHVNHRNKNISLFQWWVQKSPSGWTSIWCLLSNFIVNIIKCTPFFSLYEAIFAYFTQL